MKSLGIALSCLMISAAAFSQDLSAYEKHVFVSNRDSLPYRVLLPPKYNPAKQYPLVYFLHGAGERGNDNEKQLVHGGALFLREDLRKQFPAIVVFPQCPENSFWSNVQFGRDSSGKTKFDFPADGEPTKAMELAQGLLQQVLNSYPIQKAQVYIAGLSMGGMGTFEMVRRNPGLFAAAMPICGGANPATAPQLRGTSWWIFHGARDNVVDPQYSQEMYDALKSAKADVRLTIYPAADHNSWDYAFSENDFLPWLFSKRKKL